MSCSNYVYKNPPPQFAVISVTHSGFTSTGKLVSPIYLRERADLTWYDIVQTAKESEKLNKET